MEWSDAVRARLTRELQAPFADRVAEFRHPEHVAWLSSRLFAELGSLHELDPASGLTLHAAAVLHDIGWVQGQAKHHKRSMQMILATPIPCLDAHEQRRVACLARYHRRAFPDAGHPVFGDLPRDQQDEITRLAALLRVADGLDRGQTGRVCEVRVLRIDSASVNLDIRAASRCPEELYGATKKSDLFRHVFGRALFVRWRPEELR